MGKIERGQVLLGWDWCFNLVSFSIRFVLWSWGYIVTGFFGGQGFLLPLEALEAAGKRRWQQALLDVGIWVDVLGGDRSVTAPRVPWQGYVPTANRQMTSHIVVQISVYDICIWYRKSCADDRSPKNSPPRHDLLNHEPGSVDVHKETEMDASTPKKEICKVTKEYKHKKLWVGACKKIDKKDCREQKQCEWCVDTTFTKCWM